ncbi:FAD-binding protein [Salmonella enterica subsp. enterica]|uniref:FAD-binding protein n=1 Tax=Salmonella enterica I TaxID=59201 RepID=A0A447U4C6_SALET|nr:FAD-binding protein [Salmonella enterica subsp. enterica]
MLHVRPALDMCDPQQELLMKQISDEVVALTARYGGAVVGASMEKVFVRNTARPFSAKFCMASCAK